MHNSLHEEERKEGRRVRKVGDLHSSLSLPLPYSAGIDAPRPGLYLPYDDDEVDGGAGALCLRCAAAGRMNGLLGHIAPFVIGMEPSIDLFRKPQATVTRTCLP